MFTGQFTFTWQQFMIGIQSSLIMFPVNFIIVTIFRQTCPREMSCCQRTTVKADATELAQSPSSTNTRASVTLDSITNVGALCFMCYTAILRCLHMSHNIATDA